MTQGSVPQEMHISFPDNHHLAALCGPYDQHMVMIEEALAVQITRRGNQFTLSGAEPESVERAHELLRQLYQRLEEGREVSGAAITAALRFLEAPDAALPSPDATLHLRTRKRRVEPRSPMQAQYLHALAQNELVFGIGPAGTGKTYLAVAMAVSMFIEGKVDKILLSRPAVEAGERLGFLPGDMKEKIDPYMQPLYDALQDFLPGRQLARYMEEKQIEIAPLAFMRGRTLSNAFVILDEAQNTTTMQMRMFLTRLGRRSRMVVTGDISQIDLPPRVPSGLKEALNATRDVPGIGRTQFSSVDVVRHPMVAKIINAYAAYDNEKSASAASAAQTLDG